VPINSSDDARLSQTQHSGADSRILIVDDEDVVRGLFAESLSESYECVTAANAQEALNCLAEQQFAVAISDVQMPGMDGIDLLRKIVKDFPDVSVIMVSGVGRSQRVREALRLGALNYLIKPCDLDVLHLSVERALERRGLLRAVEHYRQELERRDAELAHLNKAAK
jgi:DNA-binding NtrC family response regulator